MTLPQDIPASRLTLRKYRPGDGPHISSLIDSNRERLLESFAELARGLNTPAQAEAFVADKAALWESGATYCYGIRHQPSDVLIGQLQVKNVAWNIPSAELSYFLAQGRLRQGFAREALAAVLRQLFEAQRFERIFLRIITSNHASLQLANQLGFKHEGLHRNEFRCGRGKIHDVHYFSIIAPEYRQIHAIVRP